MKGFLSGISVAVLAAFAVIAVAEDKKPAPEKKVPEELTLQGELIDLACYLAEGKCGQDHWKQAKACVKAGTPAALLTFDGKLYIVTPHGREGFSPLNNIGEKVRIRGIVYERDGVRCIVAKETDKLPPYAGEGDNEGGHRNGGGDAKGAGLGVGGKK